MKNKLIPLLILFYLVACDQKQTSNVLTYHESKLKSDVLAKSTAKLYFSNPTELEEATLSILGDHLLRGIAVYKVVDSNGEEVYCENFPATQLIQPEYKTANATLKEYHLRAVVEGYFVNNIHKEQDLTTSYTKL